MATTETLLTADDFLQLPDNGRPAELVRGRIVMMNVPGYQHGAICARLVSILGTFVADHELGTVLCNDSGVVTQRQPDSVRGADVAFYSYSRVPKGVFPRGYPAAAPELIFEVRSPDDRSSEIQEKVAEYLNAGVTVVCVVEPDDETVIIHRPDQPPATLAMDQELTGLACLPGFSLPVRRIL